MRLTKIFSIFLLLLAAILFHQSMSARGGHFTPSPAGDQNVSFFCSATDSRGVPLRELTKNQVTILDGSQPAQSLELKDASDLPLDLGIILLASKEKFDQERAAAIDLAQKVMRPGKDKIFAVTAGGDKSWTSSNIPWMTDPGAVASLVKGLDKNTGLRDLFLYQLSTDATAVDRLSIQTYNLGSGFSVFDVIWAMMKNDPRPAQRAVMIFRAPTAHGPGFGARVTHDSEETHNRVIAIAQSLGISFFTIGLDDNPPQSETARNSIKRTYVPLHDGNTVDARQYDADVDRAKELQYTNGRRNVERIADETGGRSLWTNKKNYSDAVESLSSELKARYLVTFVPVGTSEAGSLRPLKVQVSGAVHVSAPRAYPSQGAK